MAPAVDSVNTILEGMTFSVDGNLYGVSPLYLLDPASGRVRAMRPPMPLESDMRGLEEINIPEPGGASVALGYAAAALLRRRRRRAGH